MAPPTLLSTYIRTYIEWVGSYQFSFMVCDQRHITTAARLVKQGCHVAMTHCHRAVLAQLETHVAKLVTISSKTAAAGKLLKMTGRKWFKLDCTGKKEQREERKKANKQTSKAGVDNMM